jgi:E3 ubiquitin-protein ligase HUWE1
LCLSDGVAESNASLGGDLGDVATDVDLTVGEAEEEIVPNLEGSGEASDNARDEPNAHGLVCPPGMDREVFNCLPEEMQQEVVDQHLATLELASQLDATSGLDPEALAALPEDMRREVIAHEQRERRLRESAPADPSNAEEMDNASFVASLAPDLRREILLTADESFLNSLPPDIIAEAQILRERASHQQRRLLDPAAQDGNDGGPVDHSRGEGADAEGAAVPTSRKKSRHGKMKVECDRSPIIYLPVSGSAPPTEPIGSSELKSLIQLMFLLSPVRPQRLLQKMFQNLCANSTLRGVAISAFTRILNDDSIGTRASVESLDELTGNTDRSDYEMEFPPRSLIGATPDVNDSSFSNPDKIFFRRRQGSSCAASIAANLPTSLRGSNGQSQMPPVVSTRVIDTLTFLSKNSPRVCLDIVTNPMVVSVGDLDRSEAGSCFEQILDLLMTPRYIKSSTNLEHLLTMIEIMIYPLASLAREEDDGDVSTKEKDAAAAAGKEWVDIPRIVVSQSRLQLLCSILKMESCREAAFTKVNGITCRLCKVEENRRHVLRELASVAQALGDDANRDLRALLVRMNDAVSQQQALADSHTEEGSKAGQTAVAGGTPSRTVTLSNSSSELKLLRVLQTLQSLCSDSTADEGNRRKSDSTLLATAEQVEILQGIKLGELWEQLSSCLKVVRVLEGIATADEVEAKSGENGDEIGEDIGNVNEVVDEGSNSVMNSGGVKLQSSSAGLLTRFLPAIEAFFVVNAVATRDEDANGSSPEVLESSISPLSTSLTVNEGEERKRGLEGCTIVGDKLVVDFVSENKVILNALLRNNAVLLEKGLRAMVQVPRCRAFLDFDVKRQWFKAQIRRLRQQASRRHGSLRLGIRRKHVFEDAYHQLRLRNADEMRSRLHITFRDEEGVDAGGLSREFFGILAKEMFNPNYALFTSTEDGCTFQPNPNSSINPDHLSYFRFVGRIVGKAVADGFLLDAHFTRSLYKHMLGLEPTHHDMEAIDPDYYKNLKMILEYSLADIGLELTFSINDISFGRSQVIDLIPDGRNILVNDETKAKYVSLVCKHRMTNSIKSQIKAYLDGFYELVSRDLIAVFTPRELELLISGLPDIDIIDLKENTDYQGWKATDPEILWFWNVMQSLSRNEKAAFLQFVTGSAKVPLAGFAELQGMRGIQKFSIHKAGGSSGALMSAHTCFNSLDLPKYASEEEMREKLLYAISEGQGSFMFA